MKLQHFVFIICFLNLSYAEDSLVDEYVKNITEWNTNSLKYPFPQNSNKYTMKADDSPELDIDREYDFIIVGAGSAGAVLAGRLSEIEQWNILLIEAGDWENSITDIPSQTFWLRGSHYNWGYNISHQAFSCAGYIDNGFNIPQGRAVGGGSVTNAMFDVRGNRDDYDKWSAMGNPGWSYEEVLPYFTKSETVTFSDDTPYYRGENGNVNKELSPIFDTIGQTFLDANEEIGRHVNKDYNGHYQMGACILQNTQINGRRDSTGREYITPYKNRQNLKIVTNTLATKIAIDKQTKTAYGVSVLKNGKYSFVRAKKEVIVSAGAINSPQLLMLSGIGPKDHLEGIGIDVIQDLPVGQNLNDHLMYDVQAYSINYSYHELSLREQVEKYLNGTGPLTGIRGMQALAFVNLSDPTSSVPDVEQILFSARFTNKEYSFYEKFNRYTKETFHYMVEPTKEVAHFYIMPLLLHPKSRGNVTLKSSDPLEYPIINPNYYSDPYDVDIMVAAMKDNGNLIKTSPFGQYNATTMKFIHPVCNETVWLSDEYWSCMIRALSTSQFHFCGTCSMGPPGDPISVVDHNLKVYGIQNLRVADCSIIPVTISGHTNTPAIMVGEKAADMIKRDYRAI